MVRINLDGSLRLRFNVDMYSTGVNAMALQPDGKLLIAGDFTE